MAVQRKLDADGNVVYEVTDDKNPEAPPVTFNGGKDTRDPSIMELAQQAGVIGTEGRMGRKDSVCQRAVRSARVLARIADRSRGRRSFRSSSWRL